MSYRQPDVTFFGDVTFEHLEEGEFQRIEQLFVTFGFIFVIVIVVFVIFFLIGVVIAGTVLLSVLGRTVARFPVLLRVSASCLIVFLDKAVVARVAVLRRRRLLIRVFSACYIVIAFFVGAVVRCRG